jgi:dipeptidyl-peptidase-3
MTNLCLALTYVHTCLSRVNILSAKSPNEEITFVHPSERELFSEWDTRTFDLQVANHELLGHGSGKLLQENKDGTFKLSTAFPPFFLLPAPLSSRF